MLRPVLSLAARILSVSFFHLIYPLGVYGLTWLANRRRVKRVNLQEQFIMAYGGLRGAVGFSLVEMINKEVALPETYLTV